MLDKLVETITESLMNWCLRKGRVLHITGTGGSNDIYLIRYYLVQSKYLNVFIHQFLRSDRDDLHDHPWNFFTYLVRGAYTEHKWNGKLGREEETRRTSGENRKVFYRDMGGWSKLMDSFQLLEFKPKNRLVTRKATDQHKVMVDHHFAFEEREFAPLTICVTGPTIRTWGFVKYVEKDAFEMLMSQLECDMFAPGTKVKKTKRKWVDWREYLGLPPDAPGRG